MRAVRPASARRPAFALALLCACADPPAPKPDDSGTPAEDNDGDGFFGEEDCDDLDPLSFPGADERCDGKDNDCDRAIDEDAVDMPTFYSDFDQDSYGDPARPTTTCDQPAGMVRNALDCDDAAPEVRPYAAERCDAIDRDCDGAPGPAGADATLRRTDGEVIVLTAAESPWVVGDSEALELCEGRFDASVRLSGAGRVAGLDADRSTLAPSEGPAVVIESGVASAVLTDFAIEGPGLEAAVGAELRPVGGAIEAPLGAALTLSLVRLRVSGAVARAAGGVVAMTGTLNVTDSEFIENGVLDGEDGQCAGGALYVEGDLTLLRSALRDNRLDCLGLGPSANAVAAGAGAYVSGALVLNGATLRGNVARVRGQAASGLARGGGASAASVELLGETLVEGNVAEAIHTCEPGGTAGSEGGGLWVADTLSFLDSRAQGNTARIDAPSCTGAALGGAIFTTGAALTVGCDRVRPCGITENTADAGTGLYWRAETGRLRSDDLDWDGPGVAEAIDGAHARSPGANASFTCTAGAACTEG